MLKLTKTGIGLLTRQYRSVLKKCWLINVGLFALSTVILPKDANAGFGFLDGENRGGRTWGVLNQGGYSNYFEYNSSSNDSAFAMAEKPGGGNFQLSIQIDGYFYQNEGNYRVLDTSDIISSVTSGSGKVVTSGAVYSALSGKQNALSAAQLNAANSGITATKVSTYDGYAATIAGKQAALNQAQLNAANSGITAAKVNTYDGYSTTIAGKADKATTLLGYGITNAYTKTEVDNLISSSGSSYSAGTGISLSGTTFSLDSDYLDNNYYRKNKKSGILNGVKEGKIGNENDDNFSKSVQNIKAINDNFVTVENKVA